MSALSAAVFAVIVVGAAGCVIDTGEQPGAGGGGGSGGGGGGGGYRVLGGTGGGGGGGGDSSALGGGFVSSVGGGSFGTGGGTGATGGGTGGGNAPDSGFVNPFDGGSCGVSDTSLAVVPAVQPPPISGGTMTVMLDGTVAVGDSDGDQVRFYDATTNAEHDVLLNVGDEPGRTVEGPVGMLFVALRQANQVAQVNAYTHTVAGRFNACSAPRGIAWSSTEQALYVACASGELARLDFSSGSGTPVRTATHPKDDLRDVMLVNGQLLVTTFRDAQVWSVASDGTASWYGGPVGVTESNTSRSFTPQVAWRTISTGSGLVMSYQQEETTQIPASLPCVFSAYGGGTGIDAGMPIVGTNLALINAGSTVPLDTGIGAAFPHRASLPVDVAVSANGLTMAVAYAGSTQVVVSGLLGSQPTGTFSNGAPPVSLGFSGNFLYVFTRGGQLFKVNVSSAASTASFVLTGLATGQQLFHNATVNQVSCASCHPEAGEDGHVWSLPEGVRRTPTLRGGLSGTEPFHWSGEETDMNMLMGDVFVARMGGANEPASKVQNLLDWLDSLPRRSAPGDVDLNAATRGAADFTALGCDSCHTGFLGTNNTTVDVGTGAAFQVPRLVEMAYRAPFLHDGSVATLADRFTALGGANHPGSSGLTADQISDLIAFLKTR